MYMIDYINFKNKITQSILENKGVLFKKFFNKDETPSWSDLLNCIFNESKKENIKNLNIHEKAYGNVTLKDKLYLVSHLTNDNCSLYFPKIDKRFNEIAHKTGINISLIGPKICLGPHIIDFHQDSWHAIALQCEGKAKWTLSNSQKIENSTYLEEFYPETGDILFFPKGLWHKIETQDSIRGGIQFNVLIQNNLFN